MEGQEDKTQQKDIVYHFRIMEAYYIAFIPYVFYTCLPFLLKSFYHEQEAGREKEKLGVIQEEGEVEV